MWGGSLGLWGHPGGAPGGVPEGLEVSLEFRGCPLGFGGVPEGPRVSPGVPDPPVPPRVRLSKRRARAGVQSGTNAVLVVKHRDMNEKELEAQVGSGEGS